ELGEGDRRRILLDPASKVFDPGVLHHQNPVTAMDLEVLALTPALSVTVNVTMKVPAFVKSWSSTIPVAVSPSPQFQENFVIVRPVGATEALASKLMRVPADGFEGE